MTAKEIKIALIEKDMTRAELAAKIGCSYSYLCHMLNGYSPTKEKYLERIKKILRA